MPPHDRSPAGRKAAPHDQATRHNAQQLLERGIGEVRLAVELALGAREQRHLALAPPAPAQQSLVFDAPARLPTPPEFYRSGSRRKPYVRVDGQGMIKQSFTSTTTFDRLWRQLEGALPGHVTKSVWVEQVLTKAIRDQLEHDC